MIQSFLIPNAVDDRQYVIFDTIFNGKHIFTACGVGKVQNKKPFLTDVGTSTLISLTEYTKYANDASITVRFQEIINPGKAKSKVKTALEAANEKEAIFFVCHDSYVYDAAVKVLHIQPYGPLASH